MKYIITLTLILNFSSSFSQWTRVTELGVSDIFTLYHKDNALYAGGTDRIYVSSNKGLTWNATAPIPTLSQLDVVSSIIIYKNELYAGVNHKGVFKSPDDGATWQNISTGIFPDVSDFCEFRGDLYAATLGNSVYKLNPANRNSWLEFNNGLSSISLVASSLAGTSNTLIAGTIRNGLYDYLPPGSTTWEERFLLPQVSVVEGAHDIVTAHDTLFWAGRTGRFYTSTDNGLNWNLFGNRLVTDNSPLADARQALVTSASFFNGVNSSTAFFYIKKDSLQNPFVNFSVVPDHFTHKIDILGGKLWDASNKGLFFMSLSDLPGITGIDDSAAIVLPVHFISFNAKCEGSNVSLTWKTAKEQNSSHFDIERSVDGVRWTVIGNLPAAVNSSSERSYSFIDNSSLQNGYYHIAEYDLDGRVQYTSVLRSSCTITDDMFTLWPNPAYNAVFINIAASNESQAMVRVFDSKGALVKVQRMRIMSGNNQLRTDIGSLANGVYSLQVDWNNGQMKKAVQVVKQ